jgi:hypothetical protein
VLLYMYDGHFQYEGPLDTDIPLDDGDSLWAGSGSDDSLLNPDSWLLDDDGVYRPIDDCDDDEVAEQVPYQRLPSLPPAFQVDPVHLDILELPGRLQSRLSTARQLLSKEDRRSLFLEDGSPNWDHPFAVSSLSGDMCAFILPPITGASALNFGLHYTCSALHPSGFAVLICLPSLLRPRIWHGATLWGCLAAQSALFPLTRMAASMCHQRRWLHRWRQDLLAEPVAVQRGIPRPLNGGGDAADSLRPGLV